MILCMYIKSRNERKHSYLSSWSCFGFPNMTVSSCVHFPANNITSFFSSGPQLLDPLPEVPGSQWFQPNQWANPLMDSFLLRDDGGFQRWDLLERGRFLRRDPCSLRAVLPSLFVCLPLLSSFFLFLSYLSSPPFPNTMKQTTWLDTFQLWCSTSYRLKSNEARSPWTMHEFRFHEAKEILPPFKWFLSSVCLSNRRPE